MTFRRAGRPSHVRPRPPSTGRPAPVKVRPRPVATSRIPTHRRIERTNGLPLVARLLFVVAVVALGAVVLYTATGGLGRAVVALGSSLDGFIGGLTATPSPRATVAPISDAPVLAAPDEPYTNQPKVDLVVTVPPDVVGDAGTKIRLYLALGDQPASPILDAQVGSTPRVVIPDVELTEGSNNFSASLVGPAGQESEPSPVISYILDRKKPPISIAAPKKGATVNRSTVEVRGKTQGRSRIVVRNDANNASATTDAAGDGTFKVTIPIETGTNAITITATDPAGNVNETTTTIRRGSGKLTSALSASIYRLRLKDLPEPLELRVVVTNPDGAPLADATVTFTLSIPGIQVITAEGQTDGNGRAVFRTTVPKGATQGQVLATVLVSTGEFGDTTDRTVITIAK